MNTQEQIIFNTANRLLAGTKTAAICIELADGKSAYLGDDAGVMRMLQNKDQIGAVVRGEAVAEVLKEARAFIENNSNEVGYGFYRPDNPNDFHPDAESCSEEEIAAHKAACEAYEKGEFTPNNDSGWISPTVHILTAPWGIGSYSYRSPDAQEMLAKIDTALSARAADAPSEPSELVLRFGAGLIEVGQGHHGDDRVPAILFGRNGAGTVGVETEGDRVMLPGECIAALTFDNPESLDVVAEKLAELRARIWPESRAADALDSQPTYEARALRAGINLMDYAKRAGWPDDGEGAFEFLQRKFYAAGMDHAASSQPTDQTAELESLGAEVARLQDALCFWLPSVTEREDEVALRILEDAFLLVGADGNLPPDFKSAQELGWIALQPTTPKGWLLALQTVVEMPNGKNELGYTLLDGVGIFISFDEVAKAKQELSLPLGWVAMTTQQLLPGWQIPEAPYSSQPTDGGVRNG